MAPRYPRRPAAETSAYVKMTTRLELESFSARTISALELMRDEL